MLYLFGTRYWDTGRQVVKVGFTDDKDEREKAYILHNPGGKFLGWRPGDKRLETKLHLRLVDWKAEFLDEWFDWDPTILQIFGESEAKIDKWLWEEKSRIFSPWPKEGTIERSILDSLREKFGGAEGEKLL